MIDLAKEGWANTTPGICESCPRYKEIKNWPASCENCIFFCLDNYETLSKSFNEFKLMEMLNAETKND